LKYDSDEPHKQGSAAERVHFKGLSTPGQGLLCELGVVASYFDDDAVVSVIGLKSPDFQRDCGAVVQHLFILLFVSIGSQMLQCTEVDVPKLSIF